MFETLKPLDPFFESFFSEQIIETLTEAGFETIDTSLNLIANIEAMRLRNFCNTDYVPLELYYLLYEMIVGSFLEKAYQGGKLPLEFNISSIGGKVQLGDTSVELKGSESINSMSEQKLLMWIDSLKSKWQEEAITCRKIKW